ncbi:exodeoxyribonuclease VII large subunit [Shimazuella sp. AN120528]|uniref:exodeoxyribonuclease VII large subunit n=1 Tax=Shimazuella soli TaxID=1892854 RepID=UPI001F0E2C9C|nr:exodeoxyribonuclease VII large subunit [Shimazuella soli]MCH5584201.1 exodeoxyribonuclease VII large subunit [Shimazuella soli]
MAKEVWTVRQLVAHLTSLVTKDPKSQSLRVEGEISNFTHHASGHMYFTLKDESARMRVVFFARFARYLLFKPKNGDRVTIRGQLDVYDRDGQVQIRALEMRNSGQGDLFTRFQSLKEQLEKEGVFQREKLPLPSHPKRIGLITSPYGAAVRDIITTLQRRYPQANVLLYPVQVQGDVAAWEISQAIEEMNRRVEVDVLIVGRGGGSIEELWAFNEEMVVRSIANSTIPIISAVGHETDTTLSDFAADVRAATPTAAAELAVPNQEDLKMRFSSLASRLALLPKKLLDSRRTEVNRLIERPIFQHPNRRLIPHQEKFQYLTKRLNQGLAANYSREERRLERFIHQLESRQPRTQVTNAKAKLERISREKDFLFQQSLEQKEKQFERLVTRLESVSPLAVMKRGYSLVYRLSGNKLVTSAEQVNPGDLIDVQLAEGKLKCQVWKKEEET